MSDSEFHGLSNSLEGKCVRLANNLILYCNKPGPRIQYLRDINSDLIMLLFENITNQTIPDLLYSTNQEEEAHNVQAVIDTLSLDLLGISLSHITGEDVVAGHSVAIFNLLEVLEGITLALKVEKERNGKVSLKRKLCRRKKSIQQRKSKSLNHSSNRISIAKTEKSGSFALVTDSKFSRPSFEKELSNIGVKSYSAEAETLTSEYPMSTVSHSSKTMHSEQSIRRSRLKEGSFTYPKGVSQRLDNQRSSKAEMKPHFRIEKVKQNRPSIVCKGSSPMPVHLKTKILNHSPDKKTQHLLKKEQEVEELFEKNLGRKVSVLEKNSSRTSRLKRLQIQNLQKPVGKTAFKPCRKSFLLPHSLRRQSIRKASEKKANGHKDRILQIHKNHPETEQNLKTGFIQELFEEFPGLKLPSQIVNHIKKKYQQHLLTLHKKIRSCILKKPKSQLQAEEVAKHQAFLSELLKKNILEEQYLRESRENRKYANKIRYRLRDARLQSAKVKQYCDEFHTEMRKKMQKRNFTEELILEKVFLDALDLQKAQVNYLCEEVKEAEEKDAKQHLAYLDALENLFQTQFAMLSEAVVTEKKEQVMQREFQEELRKEIQLMQQVILECTEDTHFREMDAELYKQRLRKK